MKRRSRKAQNINFSDVIKVVKGTPELLATIIPPLLLFILVIIVVHQILFFIPEDWKWIAVSDSISFGTRYIEWTARRLLSLLLSIPLTFITYFRLTKLIKKSAKRKNEKH
jgi:hypothetical protein